MVQLICEHCKNLFEGRPNRKTCSVRCRRIIENKRRFWDRKFSYVRTCEVNSNWETHSAEVRENWKKRGEEVREKLLKIFGDRP